MSGHSKWHSIKRAKEVTDAKKGKVFGKFAKEIVSAVRQGGNDLKSNALLRDVIARAKKANMPQVNIERLLTEKDRGAFQTAVYEAFGPGGCALIITTETDNPNRTVSEVRTILRDAGGSLGTAGSVRWKFDTDMHPLYPTTLSSEDTQSLAELVNTLTAHDDVVRVVSDTK